MKPHQAFRLAVIVLIAFSHFVAFLGGYFWGRLEGQANAKFIDIPFGGAYFDSVTHPSERE